LKLNNLPFNQIATIQKVSKNGISAKLVEMGIYPGKEIKVVFKAPFGDPLAVELDGYTLSLRKNEAELIEIG